jgi:hypothetical protein
LQGISKLNAQEPEVHVPYLPEGESGKFLHGIILYKIVISTKINDKFTIRPTPDRYGWYLN